MNLTNETKIGIFVTGVIVMLLVITWKASNFKGIALGGYEIKAQFQNIEGVETNAPVRLNGLEVGRVKSIDILYMDVPKVELVLWIRDGVKIPAGAKVFVKNMGFMGEKYIGLYADSMGNGYLSKGQMILGEEPATLEAMLADGKEIAANLKGISNKINERLQVNSENIDSIFADLKVTMKNMSGITTNLNERLTVNKHLIDETMVNVNTLSKNFEEMSYDLKMNPWKLLYKPKRAAQPPATPAK
jgi:phospholipid/cholesterol/gamma-HCH transport system substrate-binding protein